MRAYHFLREDMTAGHGEEKPWTVGEERSVKGALLLCQWGYHSGRTWCEALQYAPGPVACIVDVGGETLTDMDKQVSRSRKLIAAVDASKELRLFAADCAERALQRERDAGREPDARSWVAVEAARQFARGQIGADELDAARAAAWAAARTAARTAARDAAWAALAAARAALAAADAALDAALDAWDAWAAARAAARAARAALDAALDGAFDAEQQWQAARLNEYLMPLFAEVPA